MKYLLVHHHPVGNPAGRPRLPGLIRTPKAWDILKYLLLAHHYVSSLALVAVLYADAHHSNDLLLSRLCLLLKANF